MFVLRMLYFCIEVMNSEWAVGVVRYKEAMFISDDDELTAGIGEVVTM